VFNVISLVTFRAAVFFLATRGLHFSVEFTGGTLIEVSYEPRPPNVEPSATRWKRPATPITQVQNFGSSRDVLIRMPPRGPGDSALAKAPR
jgi:preprotein translocase subunit SecF